MAGKKSAVEAGKSVLVAMSGGVDSSIAAYLLVEQGYTCIGVTMKLIPPEGNLCSADNACCRLDDIKEAEDIAKALGMPHHTLDLYPYFATNVIDKFIAAYESGATPNPCVDCNRDLKFGRLLAYADELGCDYIATGHYVRRRQNSDGSFDLLTGVDASKDQSYMLYSLSQKQLSRALFPLGELSKKEVRALAEKQSFSNADKEDSQDICFIPDGDYLAFMEQYTGKNYPSGEIVDRSGKVLGHHRGAPAYTIGQRKGLGLAAPEPLYVLAKDMTANRLIVGKNTDLMGRLIRCDNWNWINGQPAPGLHIQVKARYRQQAAAATVNILSDRLAEINFADPQRALTPGQAAVAYDGNRVLGGGTILPLADEQLAGRTGA